MYSDGAPGAGGGRRLETRRAGGCGEPDNGLELVARAAYPQIGQMSAALLRPARWRGDVGQRAPVFGVARSWEQARQIGDGWRGLVGMLGGTNLRGPAIRIRVTGRDNTGAGVDGRGQAARRGTWIPFRGFESSRPNHP